MLKDYTISNDSEIAEKNKSVIDHLDELRIKILISLATVVIGCIFSFIFSCDIINFLKLLAPKFTEFVQLSPGEVFLVSLKVSLYTSFYLSSPVIFYQVVNFLFSRHKRFQKIYAIPIVIVAFILFTLGILFAYYVALPLTLTFLLGYGSDVVQNTISISKYISFVFIMILSLGLLFQLPLLILFLAVINIVNSKLLMKLLKYIVLIAFVCGAIITPSPDPFAQTVVALAIMILYLLSIALVKLIGK